MKKHISYLLVLIMTIIGCNAFAASDPRLDMRTGDDLTPVADTQYFTRYTPWLKVLHLTSEAEITNGYHGGEACQQIRCIDISPVDTNLAIFGTDTSGVWITTNGGDFWYNTNRNMIPADISDVFCHPTDKNIMLCYTVGKFTGVGAPGIYRSEDMGRSWTRVYTDYISSNGTNTDGASFSDNLFAYDGSGNIYAVTGRGVIKSTDNGATWNVLKSATETSSASNRIYATSIDVSQDGQTIIACYAHSGFSLNGINVSRDGGTTWSKLYISGTTDWNTYSFAMTDDGKYYIAGVLDPADTTTGYGLYISSDKGTSWTEFASESGSSTKVRSNGELVRLRLSDDYLYASYRFTDANCRRLPYEEIANASTTAWETLGIEKNAGIDTYRGGVKMAYSQGIDIQGDTMYICTAGPNESTDGGTTWTRKSSGFSGALIQHFEMDSSGNLVLSMTDGNIVRSSGAYTSTNTPSFSRKRTVSTTIATMTLTDKHDSTGNRIICWYGISNANRKSVGIIVTPDGGETYEDCTLNEDETDFSEVICKITDPIKMDTVVLEYDETEENTIYASCGTSIDNGKTWEPNDYYYLDIDGSRILAWDIYGDNGDGTNSDGTSCSYDLMYSEDKGESWISVGNRPWLTDKDINAFFDAEDENIIWYRRTDDFGKINISTKAKTSLKSKVSYQRFSNLAQNPKHPNHLLLTSKALNDDYCPSIYESYDYGNSWHVVPGLFGKRTIDGGITFSTTTNEVFIGSHNGIFVYEYDNFNYWQGLKLRCQGIEKLCTVEKTADGKITLPMFSEFFTLSDLWTFVGWEYNGALYNEGETITIGQ